MDRGPGVLGRPGTPGVSTCPPHTPALAGHPRQPQAIAQRRAFKKAACWFCAAGRALVPSAAMEDEEAKRACKGLGHQGKCKRARGAAQRTAIDASASLRSLAQSI